MFANLGFNPYYMNPFMGGGTLTWNSYPNVPFMNVLPTVTTNFGGDVQVATIDDPISYSGNLMFNMNPIAQNALLSGGMNPSGGIGMPQIPDAKDLIQAFDRPGAIQQTSQKIKTSLALIEQQKTRLNSIIGDDKADADTKAKVQELLKKLEAEEEKLNALKASTNLTPDEAYKIAFDAVNRINEIVKDVNKLVADMNSTPAPTTETSATTATESTTSTDGTSETAPSEPTEPTKLEVPTYSPEAKELADKFYDAVNYRFGTDNAKFNEVCDSINEDNVMDVMYAYKAEHSAKGQESFMLAFMYDADITQKREYGRKIKQVLSDKAEALGIRDELDEQFAILTQALGPWKLTIDNGIAQTFDEIIAAIAQKEGKIYRVSDFAYS